MRKAHLCLSLDAGSAASGAHRLLAYADGIWVTRDHAGAHFSPRRLSMWMRILRGQGAWRCCLHARAMPYFAPHVRRRYRSQPSSDRSLRLCWRQCIIAPADRHRYLQFCALGRKGFRMFFGIFSIVCACMGKSRDDSERGRCSL